jgi:hypothetical protein
MRYAMQGEYILWITLSTIGLLQAIAAYYRWDGLLFFRGHPRFGYLISAILIPGSYFWFFSFRERDVPGLEGWQLFSRFALAACLGLAIVLVASSVLNARMRAQSGEAISSADPQGVDALRNDTFVHLMLAAKTLHAPVEPAVAAGGQNEEQNG